MAIAQFYGEFSILTTNATQNPSPHLLSFFEVVHEKRPTKRQSFNC